MITIREAGLKAAEFLQELLPNVSEILVEEVEKDDTKNHWIITLGFKLPPINTFEALGPIGLLRKYKTFRVDADNGNVISMKIRELAR